MTESMEDEVVRLRAEIESYRQRELADLKAALTTARQDADHYRSEAQRNADLGQQIAAGYQQQVADLKSKLDAQNILNQSRRPVIDG